MGNRLRRLRLGPHADANDDQDEREYDAEAAHKPSRANGATHASTCRADCLSDRRHCTGRHIQVVVWWREPRSIAC